MTFLLILSLVAAVVYSLPIEEGAGSSKIEASISVTSPGKLLLRNKRADDSSEGCFPTKMCYSDEDCTNGKCVGALVGRCNCMQCIDFARCDEDSMCSGLKGACDRHVDMCNCTMGYLEAGFHSLADALVNLCDTKPCTKDNADEECFGLPCIAGTCVCEKDKK
ncbi:hypothetical protein TELCIR_01449 [Teladorsagia circumcincta]|uniref:EB module n=1 Tax=Teladorsagia circumcincta TaxID=45464 RepID=A0A2G9V1U7_TELCI|nr:hypothetical protein TELCIR_01449 [Teladorsagia circumcincta]